MPRKPKVQRTPEEKWQIVLEGVKSGNVAETCRKYEIAPRFIIAGKTKWKWELKLRLGGEAPPRGPMPHRRSGSSNWNERWAVRICRSRS